MPNPLEYILKLNDMLTPSMRQAAHISESSAAQIQKDMEHIATTSGHTAQSMSNQFGQAAGSVKHLEKEVDNLKQKSSGIHLNLGGILGTVGIGFGLYQIGEMMHEGIEKAHSLHAAEAQLANTMKNMGTYSKEAFEEAVKGAGNLSKGILFSRSEVIDLQAQLRMVGNIGESEMERMTKASADMATKFHIGISEAGNSIAKAVNNPEMLRRLAMQLKIDPGMQQHLQDLAKNGKEAKARLELLTIVEQKVGGAAAAAFNADPLARYHKAIGEIQMVIGNAAIRIQTALAPALTALVRAFSWVITAVSSVVNWFRQHQVVTEILAAVIGVLVTSIIIYNGYVWASAAATKIAALFTGGWRTAFLALNGTMWANPIFWIIAGIVALIALIGYVIYTTDGWGKQWDSIMKFFKYSWASFKDFFSILWLGIQDGFMSGIELIEKGWYHLKSLWDSEGAKAGLAKINTEQNKRAEEIAQAKGLLISDLKAAEGSLKWELHSNGKGLGDMVTDLKKKLGISTGGGVDPTAQGAEGKGGIPGGYALAGGKEKASAVNSGGQRSIVITIGKQIEKLEVHVMNAKEGAIEIESMVREALRRSVYSLNNIGS